MEHGVFSFLLDHGSLSNGEVMHQIKGIHILYLDIFILCRITINSASKAIVRTILYVSHEYY